MKYSEWVEYFLGDVCTVTDCLHKTAPTVEYSTSYRMLRTSNIRNGKIDIEGTKSVTKETYDKWSLRGYLNKGDVILTREAPMGEVGIITNSDYKFFLGQRMLQLQANQEIITPDFLYYSLQGRDLQHQINMNEGTGSVVSNIRIPVLKKMKIKAPPIEIQNKITDVLSKLDEKIDLNNQIIANLEKLAQTLFKRWFIDFEFPNEDDEPYYSSGGNMVESVQGQIPEQWKIDDLDQFIKITSGKRPGKDIKKGKVPIMGASKVMGYVDEALYHERIIVTGRVGTHGIINRVETASWPSDNTLVIQSENYEFVYQFLQRVDFKSLNRGSTQPLITQKDIKNLKIIYPENKQILKKFEEINAKYFSMVKSLKEENETLITLKNSLLPKLLSGELEIYEEGEAEVNATLQ